MWIISRNSIPGKGNSNSQGPGAGTGFHIGKTGRRLVWQKEQKRRVLEHKGRR